jgi:hypothetical protein
MQFCTRCSSCDPSAHTSEGPQVVVVAAVVVVVLFCMSQTVNVNRNDASFNICSAIIAMN